MRTGLLVVLAGVALCACATDERIIREARASCQAVGITEKDPQFTVCTQAMSRQRLEDRIHDSYHGATQGPITDAERRTPHVDVY